MQICLVITLMNLFFLKKYIHILINVLISNSLAHSMMDACKQAFRTLSLVRLGQIYAKGYNSFAHHRYTCFVVSCSFYLLKISAKIKLWIKGNCFCLTFGQNQKLANTNATVGVASRRFTETWLSCFHL